MRRNIFFCAAKIEAEKNNKSSKQKNYKQLERIELIQSLAEWGRGIEKLAKDEDEIYLRVAQQNGWFTEANTRIALKNIAEKYLEEKNLADWIPENFPLQSKRHIGIVMAGNIPVVGFHDLLSVLISGAAARVKLSSKDSLLLPHLVSLLNRDLALRISFSEMLTGADAFIATGSNNSARYFENYFSKYPHIIRRNRGSVAVITGEETAADLTNLGKDVFQFFGLGCRNVSKLFIPENYQPENLLPHWADWKEVMNHNKYRNNFDYALTLMLMNKQPILTSDLILLREEQQVISPVATLHFERYKNEDDLLEKLVRDREHIQCTIGNGFATSFGASQSPALSDYADGVDTVQFLANLLTTSFV